MIIRKTRLYSFLFISAVFFVAGASIVAPLTASAALTEPQIQSILALLQSFGADATVVNNVNSSLRGLPTSGGGGGQQWCHTFNRNLGIGSNGDELSVLLTALGKEDLKVGDIGIRGTTYYDELIAAAVTAFQEKYRDEILTPNGLKYGTGYVGPSTRAKLNRLYGCGITIPYPIPTPPTPSGTPVPTPIPTQFSRLYIEVDTGGGLMQTSDAIKVDVGQSRRARAMYVPLMPPCSSGFACAGMMPAPQEVSAQWTSSNSSIAAILSLAPGCVTNPPDTTLCGGSFTSIAGISAGTAEIKALYAPYPNAYTTTAKVNVVAPSTQPSITVISPNGGESWQTGTAQTIKWQPYKSNFSCASNTPCPTPTPAPVTITLVRYVAPCTTNVCPLLYPVPHTLATNITDSGSFDWTVGKDINGLILVGQYTAHVSNGYSSDSSDAPFSIVAAETTNYTLSASYVSGNKNSYAAGEKISLAIKGIELFDGSPGESGEGFNVQVYVRGTNDGYSLQGINAVYNSQTGYWDAKLTAPADTSKTYKVDSAFYCSNSSLACGQRYPSGAGGSKGQVNIDFNFSVSGSGKTPVMVVSPNGGESYQAGQSAQMSIGWTADCGYKSFSIMLAKGTYNGFSSQMVNDSIPAGICSSGQTAIPYGTTWPIPANLAAGSDYKILITGQLADSIVGQFGYNLGDDSDKPFSIVGTSQPLTASSAEIIGSQSNYSPGQTIKFNVKGIASDGSVGLPTKGFNVQAWMQGPNGTVQIGGVYQSFNATYDANSALWNVVMTAPSDASQTYKIEVAFYCSNSSAGCSSGQINKSFTFNLTQSQPSITVTSPKPGSVLAVGMNYNVNWSYSGISSGAAVNIEIQKGSNVVKVYGGYLNTGSQTLQIPSDLVLGSDYQINVIYKITPDSGVIGSTAPLQIVSSYEGGYDTCRLDKLDGNNITRDAIVDQSSCLARICDVYGPANLVNGLESKCLFKGQEIKRYTKYPSITVLSPNGGESWHIGNTYTIQWVPGNIEVISVQLLKNGISVYRWDPPYYFSSINWQIQNSSIFGTLVPDSDYKIRVNYRTTVGDAFDDSDAPFSIVAATAIAPNSSQTANLFNAFINLWWPAGFQKSCIQPLGC